jgi:hypothetical protein
MAAYSIFEQLTSDEPHSRPPGPATFIGSSPFVGKNLFRKWVKSGCKNPLLGIVHYRKFYLAFKPSE